MARMLFSTPKGVSMDPAMKIEMFNQKPAKISTKQNSLIPPDFSTRVR
jgi:hypothetical protein